MLRFKLPKRRKEMLRLIVPWGWQHSLQNVDNIRSCIVVTNPCKYLAKFGASPWQLDWWGLKNESGQYSKWKTTHSPSAFNHEELTNVLDHLKMLDVTLSSSRHFTLDLKLIKEWHCYVQLEMVECTIWVGKYVRSVVNREFLQTLHDAASWSVCRKLMVKSNMLCIDPLFWFSIGIG